jgi:ABC-2 type transport system permease protein
MAPIGRATVLGGKLLARYVVGVTQMLILFAFGHLAFQVALGQSLPTFVVLTLLVVFSLTGFSLLVAAFARTREQIIPLGLTVVMLVCAIGGCWWPLFMEPPWLQQVAHATPTAWAMDGLSDLILRDRTLAEIGPILAVLLAYGLACLAAGAWLYPLADRPSRRVTRRPIARVQRQSVTSVQVPSGWEAFSAAAASAVSLPRSFW